MTQSLDHQYIAVLKDLINKSESNPEIRDRTGVGTFKSFGNIITADILSQAEVRRYPTRWAGEVTSNTTLPFSGTTTFEPAATNAPSWETSPDITMTARWPSE